MDNQTKDFFDGYRGRYSRFWIERWGLIPELPTSFDNANSMYELIAWLQRAFKDLLDDFQQLESELEDFKNALTELLEYLVPELIRRYHNSDEFKNLFIKLLKDILMDDERNWFRDYLKSLLEGDLKEWFKEYLKTSLNNEKLKEFFKGFLKTLLDDPVFLTELKQILGVKSLEERVRSLESKNQLLEETLMKLINNLTQSGAWTGGLGGGLVDGRSIATGNINIFGGTPDGNSFIRTNKGQTENDLTGGI